MVLKKNWSVSPLPFPPSLPLHTPMSAAVSIERDVQSEGVGKAQVSGSAGSALSSYESCVNISYKLAGLKLLKNVEKSVI